tara:strand:+ start:728 stop:1216 length:489 start_codon:yes stop_codon:yes gene_type:complete
MFKFIDFDKLQLDLRNYGPYRNRNNNKYVIFHENIYTVIYKNPLNLLTFIEENKEYFCYFCPGMFSVIRENGKLKGYQTYKGKHISNETFQNYMENNKEYIKEFTKKSRYWYVDWKPNNFVLINNEMTLIDLDSFRLIEKTSTPIYKKNYWGGLVLIGILTR